MCDVITIYWVVVRYVAVGLCYSCDCNLKGSVWQSLFDCGTSLCLTAFMALGEFYWLLVKWWREKWLRDFQFLAISGLCVQLKAFLLIEGFESKSLVFPLIDNYIQRFTVEWKGTMINKSWVFWGFFYIILYTFILF